MVLHRSRPINSQRKQALLATAVILAAYGWAADLPTFPGADGAGGTVTGDRGGSVYHVTILDSKLADNQPGTLYYGLTHTGGNPTTIVFDVGGTVWLGLKTTDIEGWDTQNSINIPSNVTIAGQTAPGGITIMGSQLKVNGSTIAGQPLPVANTVIRNVNLAVGYGIGATNSISGYHDNYTYDNMDINSSGVMVDHVTALFATDESISANELASKITVQYSTIGQGQSYPQADAQGGGAFKSHALGDLWGLGSNASSTFSHNLYVNISGRIPTLQTVASKLTNNVPGYTDFRNNVVYNWYGTAGYGSSGEPGAGEFEGNYYKVGPGGDGATGSATDPSIVPASGGTTPFSGSSSTLVYQTGNIRYNLNGTITNLTNSNFGSTVFQPAQYPAIPYNGITDSATSAYNQVLSYVGSNWQSRDAINARLVNQVATGTGKITAFDDPTNGYNSAGQYITNTNDPDIEWNRLLALRSTVNGGNGGTGNLVRTANFDSDNDGMPNTWETAHGLNPNVADNNGDYESNGYTNLEKYINELGAFPASAPLTFNNGNANGRFAELGNWTTGVWQPSRFDEAQINAGTATIDAVGQHARLLKIGTNTGNTAALSMTSGWMDVADSVQISPGGTGTVTLTGGILHVVNNIVIGGTANSGTLILNGGTLAAHQLSKGSKAGSTFTFTAGTLHADIVAFDLTNNGGTLAPGSDANVQNILAAAMPNIDGTTEAAPATTIGNTHINGKLNLPSGHLQIELASLASFDTLTVDSTFTMGGALDVVLLPGYSPTPGTKWLIGTASSYSGNFSSITPGFSTFIQGNNLFLALPEPTSLTLLGLGGILLLRRRSRRSEYRL